jgi:hypothetical protein
MSGGRHRGRRTIVQEARKGALLSADERATAARLRRMRFSPAEIARAIGRTIPDVEDFLNSPEAQHA